MPNPLRTNPQYAHLAYRRTIILKASSFLRRQFIGDELTQPREALACDLVLPVDARVPQEEVQHYLETLNEEVAAIDLQLNRYKFVPPENHDHDQAHQQQKNKKGAGKFRSPVPQGPGKQSQGRGH